MKKYMYCPICDKEHEVDIVYKKITILSENHPVSYTGQFYKCANTDAENEFMDGAMLDENLSKARAATQKEVQIGVARCCKRRCGDDDQR